MHENLLFADLGDFFGNRTPAQEKSRSRVVVDYMRMAKYDVVTIGEQDMNYGLAFLLDQIKEGTFDVVGANLYGKRDSTLLFEPYVVKTVGGVKVGFIGLTDDDPRKVGVFQQLEAAYVTGYTEALREYLPELQEKCDIVVCLAHIGLSNARRLAEKVPELDIILVGHGSDRTAMAEKVGETIIVKSGSKSSSIGSLMLSLDDSNRIVAFDGISKTLTKHGRSNLELQGMVTTCEERQKVRDRLLAKRRYRLPTIPKRPEVLAGEGYLGWDTCKQCHSEIYERWADDPHAHAFATLAEGDKWDDPACLPCHVTGYEFAAVRDSTDIRPELWNVQCEACHGMGTKHARDGSMRPVPESVCLKCHTPEWTPEWNYVEAVKMIDHGKDGKLD